MPEAAKGKSRMVRGLEKNTWARLLEDYDPNYTMAKEEARRCHARVIGHEVCARDSRFAAIRLSSVRRLRRPPPPLPTVSRPAEVRAPDGVYAGAA